MSAHNTRSRPQVDVPPAQGYGYPPKPQPAQGVYAQAYPAPAAGYPPQAHAPQPPPGQKTGLLAACLAVLFCCCLTDDECSY